MTLTKKHDFLISVAIVLFFILANILVTASANPGQPRAVNDVELSSSVKTVLLSNPETSRFPIAVASNNATITLSGRVESSETRALAADIAREVDGVVAVENRLVIASVENYEINRDMEKQEIQENAEEDCPCEPAVSGIPKIIRPNS